MYQWADRLGKVPNVFTAYAGKCYESISDIIVYHVSSRFSACSHFTNVTGEQVCISYNTAHKINIGTIIYNQIWCLISVQGVGWEGEKD